MQKRNLMGTFNWPEEFCPGSPADQLQWCDKIKYHGYCKKTLHTCRRTFKVGIKEEWRVTGTGPIPS